MVKNNEISFRQFPLHFRGNVHPGAIQFGDVDGDGNSELVAGSITGDVCVYKGSDFQPWRHFTHLGTVTCVAVGEIACVGRPSLVVVSAEGWCYIFDIQVRARVRHPFRSPLSGP